MLEVDLLEPTPTKPEQAINTLRDTLMPLYTKWWTEIAQSQYDKPLNMHISLFLELWFGGGLKCVVAKENGKAVGFAVCIMFRPLQYEASVLQIHDMYASGSNAVADKLWEYIEQLARMLNCNELWFDEHSRCRCVNSARWREQKPMMIRRFTKEE